MVDCARHVTAATIDYMRRYTAGFNGNPPGLSYGYEYTGSKLPTDGRSASTSPCNVTQL